MLTNISLFSGAGGLDLAAKWTGRIKTVAYCEYDRYAQGVLMSRIRDGGLDDAPIWDDVSSFDGKPWRGTDIISGGFPCQDVSVAGKRAGLGVGTRTGLFFELIRICREVRPRFILLENVRGLLIYPGAHRVFGELAGMGYDAGWKVISASDVGANHQRKRIWIVAYPNGVSRKTMRGKCETLEGKMPIGGALGGGCENNVKRKKPIRGAGKDSKNVADTKGSKCEGGGRDSRNWRSEFERSCWWATEPDVGRVANGVAFRMDRLKRTGNGVVPQQALPAWEEIIRLSDMEKLPL